MEREQRLEPDQDYLALPDIVRSYLELGRELQNTSLDRTRITELKTAQVDTLSKMTPEDISAMGGYIELAHRKGLSENTRRNPHGGQ